MLEGMLSMLSPMVVVWIVALVFFIAVEAATVSLVSVWFCGGALVALIAAGLSAPIWAQVLLFLAVSGLLLALLAPVVRKYIRPKKEATNADRNIGKTALVTEEINNLAGTGAVVLSGVTWTAVSEDGQVIPPGQKIVVRRIKGSKLLVRPAEESV